MNNNFMNHFNFSLDERFREIRERLYSNLEDWKINFGYSKFPNLVFEGSIVDQNYLPDVHEPVDRCLEETLTYVRDYCLDCDEDPRNWLEMPLASLRHMMKNYFKDAHDIYLKLKDRRPPPGYKKSNNSQINIEEELRRVDGRINFYIRTRFAHSDRRIDEKLEQKEMKILINEVMKKQFATNWHFITIIFLTFIGILFEQCS